MQLNEMYATVHKKESIMENIMADPWYREPHKKSPFSCSSHNLSPHLKRIALQTYPSVVGILSYIGETEIFRASGFVIQSKAFDGKFVSTILTSASVLRPETSIDAVATGIKINVMLSNKMTCEGAILGYDFHYNIGAIKIVTDVPITTARLRRVDDAISFDPTNLMNENSSTYQSDKFYLVPGDTVIALGRYHVERNGLMIFAGEYSPFRRGEQTVLDCDMLFRAEFVIPMHGIGGPLINCNGEVIGISFYNASFTPFLPINIAAMWWEQFDKYHKCPLPRLEMKLSSLHMAYVGFLESVLQKFPHDFKGVVVDAIRSDSPAYSTGILIYDVIVGCNGKSIGSILELLEAIWDKVGQHVKFDVLRPSNGSRLNITMVVGHVDSNQVNKWLIPDRKRGRLRKYRVVATGS